MAYSQCFIGVGLGICRQHQQAQREHDAGVKATWDRMKAELVDEDSSGDFNREELQDALQKLGMQVEDKVLDAVRKLLRDDEEDSDDVDQTQPDDDRFPSTNTVVVAIAIPAMNQPQTFINPKYFEEHAESDPTVQYYRTTTLLDTMLASGNRRAIGSEVLRAIICHQWRRFGYAFSVQEAVCYLSFYLAPFLCFAVKLANLPHASGFRFEQEWECVVGLAIAFLWVCRQVKVEHKQYRTDGSVSEYFESFWNCIDVATISLFVLTALSYGLRSWMSGLIYCKQVTAVAVITAFLKSLHCAQTIPSLARLVQLIVATVPKMRDFLAIL